MGLLRELVDEVISLPDSASYTFPAKDRIAATSKLGYAIINAFFQFLDCMIIPWFTLLAVSGKWNIGFFNWIVVLVGTLGTLFSWGQVLYYFAVPTDKYVHPLRGRILGETAIGVLVCAIFKIPIHSKVK